ncbi:uncharacterized protein LOC127290571 isoform X2 [Leptopilina boulardi]|uniref:uncharacterized protein LOC127280385 isoform X2 n=1 Tax=Leptopilina boulardi TaxID=63433 RepID=UPI0021F60D5F|nr:uncharacterized protein LOC127280385 isoform X2 [Leptopilina boulardi]XP_051175217.1 uncharacterized protein LOC127290571 isoform X2 [Leptopilina boulardi]
MDSLQPNNCCRVESYEFEGSVNKQFTDLSPVSRSNIVDVGAPCLFTNVSTNNDNDLSEKLISIVQESVHYNGSCLEKDVLNFTLEQNDSSSMLNDCRLEQTDCTSGSSVKNTSNWVLQHFLESSGEGKVILKAYIDNRNFLSDQSRTLLVHLIIRSEKEKLLKYLKVGEQIDDWKIDKRKFKFLASEIVKTFPNEGVAVYYSPFHIENGCRILASGRLYDNFNYEKAKLRKAGILKPSKKTKPEEKTFIISDSQSRDLRWLEENSTPWDVIEKLWKSTFSDRREMLLSNKKSLNEYLDSIKAFKEHEGRKLVFYFFLLDIFFKKVSLIFIILMTTFFQIELDFKLLYPDSTNPFPQFWNVVKPILVQHLNTTRIADANDKILLSLLSALDSSSQDVILFYLLLYVIPCGNSFVQGKRKRKDQSNELAKQYTKLNTQEKRDTYMLHVKTVSEFQPTLDKIRENANEKKEDFKPLTVIVGPLVKIEKFYVVFSNITYECDTLLNAFHLSFMSFQSFNCEYPMYSKSIWHFIQSALYGINITGKRISNKLNVLIAQTKQAIELSKVIEN